MFIRDLDLIKEITVKAFDNFPEHREVVCEDTDPLWGKNLISSRGTFIYYLNFLTFVCNVFLEKRWKQLRPMLSPTFTSSKMKMMFILMKEVGEKFANYFLEQEETVIKIDSKDAFTKFTTDVVGSIIFGIECNSFKDPNNEFRNIATEATNFKGLRFLKFILGPKIKKVF